ncbi:hypothetical protein NPIL_95741 [Nephila pilipes]|uniref:Uncharacterized protein n=1 Tax=Nephila pilipes TaxID=299642 RepID=A0A8X6Q0K1_NEPPI|nr:hypothetical protein NPIL_95741 [Nephila pilipes]
MKTPITDYRPTLNQREERNRVPLCRDCQVSSSTTTANENRSRTSLYIARSENQHHRVRLQIPLPGTSIEILQHTESENRTNPNLITP